jgi:hypothetical protein
MFGITINKEENNVLKMQLKIWINFSELRYKSYQSQQIKDRCSGGASQEL